MTWNLSYRITACVHAPSHVVKQLPHVHYRQANAPVLFSPSQSSTRHARLFAILSRTDRIRPCKSGRSPRCGRYRPCGSRSRRCRWLRAWHAHAGGRAACTALQDLDRLPVKPESSAMSLMVGLTTAPPNVVGKRFAIEGLSGRKIEPLRASRAATLARTEAHLDLQKDARIATRQITTRRVRRSYKPECSSTTSDCRNRFFERRLRVMTHAFGSPKARRAPWSGTTRGPGGVRIPPKVAPSLRRIDHTDMSRMQPF